MGASSAALSLRTGSSGHTTKQFNAQNTKDKNMNTANPGLRLYMAKLRLKTPKGFSSGSSGVLSAKQRQNLPRSSFALPGKGKGPKGAGAGSYPIPDASHARNALARVSQHGSPAEKAAVRAKVHAKYPNIGKKNK
jgi:hypothetical protein